MTGAFEAVSSRTVRVPPCGPVSTESVIEYGPDVELGVARAPVTPTARVVDAVATTSHVVARRQPDLVDRPCIAASLVAANVAASAHVPLTARSALTPSRMRAISSFSSEMTRPSVEAAAEELYCR